jgi:hypothetical protein
METWSFNAILKPNFYQEDPLCVQYLLNFMYLNVSGQK